MSLKDEIAALANPGDDVENTYNTAIRDVLALVERHVEDAIEEASVARIDAMDKASECKCRPHLQNLKNALQVADEIETWSQASPYGGPDVLSMTEIVAENWQTIVVSLREVAK